jgi:hypothetical protein
MKWGWDQQSDWWLRLCRRWLIPAAVAFGVLFLVSGIRFVADGQSKGTQPLVEGTFLLFISVSQWFRVRAETARRENELVTNTKGARRSKKRKHR